MERRLSAILATDVAGYSRMMSKDELGTLSALQNDRAEIIDPAITRHRGRIVKLMGDGLLAEFASVVEAVECAVEIQQAVGARAASGKRMIYRMGVHLGDIIVDGDDIYGDGVNIAARLEGIADPGGICISRQAYDQVHNKLHLHFQRLGSRNLKNIPEPVEVFAVGGTGSTNLDERQEVRFVRASDGVRLAYATSGHGPPLVKTGNWLSHLEFDWESPVWNHFLHELSREHTLIRYDPRGTGLSDWDVSELSLDAWVGDLETVVDAVGLTRFPLLGYSQGCAISIAYAARHPERVSHLVLYGGFALGASKRSPQEAEKRRATTTLVRLEWGSNSPALRQFFTMQFMPDSTKEQADSFNELQRRTTSPECAARYFEATGKFDVTELLSKVTAPTLVMHSRGDLRVPLETGRQLAAGISGARFVPLNGNNHILLEQDQSTQRFFEELRLFLDSAGS
jgi:class 3 adenylate cyclase/pimeloyl-ACP methyl ester carboxylesterase